MGFLRSGESALATETFTDHANDVIDTSTDIHELLAISAEASLLGLQSLSDDAFDTAGDIARKNLDAAAEAFTDCSNDQASVEEFFKRVAQSALLSGDDRYDEVNAWREVQLRRKTGESIPECEGGDFTASSPLQAGWNGTITAHLTSCDSIDWTGDVVAFGTLDLGGAQMTMDSSVPLSVTTDDGRAAGVAHRDFVRCLTPISLPLRRVARVMLPLMEPWSSSSPGLTPATQRPR